MSCHGVGLFCVGIDGNRSSIVCMNMGNEEVRVRLCNWYICSDDAGKCYAKDC